MITHAPKPRRASALAASGLRPDGHLQEEGSLPDPDGQEHGQEHGQDTGRNHHGNPEGNPVDALAAKLLAELGPITALALVAALEELIQEGRDHG